MSVVAAAITKYGTLTIPGVSPLPPIYFAGIPQTGTTGSQLVLPWVNLVDESGTQEDQSETAGYDFEANPVEVTVIRFEVYAVTLAQVDLIMNGIKYSNGAFNARLGFDFGTLTITYQTLLECRRTREQRFQADQLQETAKQVHQGSIWYAVQAQVTGPT